MPDQPLAEAAEAFVTFSVNGRLGRAGQLLSQHPEIAGYDVRTAIALGDAARFSDELARDPDLPVRRDPRTGWTALHLACASRWHMDPARAAGLLAIVAALLDAGADLDRPPAADSQWSPLRGAIASTGSGRGNEPIVRLLLDRGAEVHDDDLYLAGFAEGGEQWCLRLLAEHTPNVRGIAEKALAAPISLNDADGVRVLLEAGADPRRYRDDDGDAAAVVPAAIAAACGLALIESLLAHGADPDAIGGQGRSAYAVAIASGRDDLAGLLARYGAHDDTTPLDHLKNACLRGDRAAAQRLLGQHESLRSAAAGADGSALILAAESGNDQGIELLLDAGFRATAEGRFEPAGVDGATALHAAAWAGSAESAARLLAAGAPADVLDGNWQSTPIVWALIGSSEHRATNPDPDWAATVRILLDTGAETSKITLDPDEPQPSPAVVALLRARGILPPPTG
ncbi:MAG TPA: ankyrin repeat domain-containing protein [Streptosporangiaceae bacterium]|nr:ankyrin repeat domain-containing protein [Streptosporangiaceae bacterium]